MPKKSAGLLVFRRKHAGLEILLVHPGGPFWSKKDNGAWSIPKGEFEESEDPMKAALREFTEETGTAIRGDFISLDPVRQPGGKVVYAWAVEEDVNPEVFRSNTFILEWPPGSGRRQEFPEIDRAQWFPLAVAQQKILKGQQDLITQLSKKLDRS